MGYTHYWSIKAPCTEAQRVEIAAAVARVIYAGQKADRFKLDGVDGGPPLCDQTEIFFNGIGALSHETFVFDFEPVEFDFCKTAAKPYDVAVCAALVIAKVVLGAGISVRSDGDDSDWQNGVELAQQALGRDIDFELDVRR